MLSALIPLSVVIAGSSIILGFVALSRSRTSSGDTLAGQLMKIDLESGRILGALESPGAHAESREQRRHLRSESDRQRIEVATC